MQKHLVSVAAAVVALGSTFAVVTSASAFESYSPSYMSPQRLQPSRSIMNNNLYRHWTTGTTCYSRNGYAVRGKSCNF